MRIAAFVLAVSVAAASAQGQSAYSDLSGLVTAADGAAVQGVAVTAHHPDTGFRRASITSAEGAYAIAGLRAGVYDVTFERDGFRTTRQKGVELRLGQTTRLSATLEPAVLTETITVAAKPHLLDVTTKQIGDTLTADDLRDLPTQNRSFVLFAGLIPGVVPNAQTDSSSSDALYVNGQHQANNSFHVDGTRNDDPTAGSIGGAQVRTPLEAIQEFQVLTSQFDAELGGATGGILNAITKSGTNRVSGSAFVFFQNSRWNEREFFARRADLPPADASFESGGFTVGGPLVRDRLHYFVSFEGTRDREGHTRFFASRPDLSYSTTENNRVRNVLARGDHQLTSHHHFSVRYLAEDAPQLNKIVGAGTALDGAREEHDGDMNAIGSVDSVVASRLFNSLHAAFNEEHFVNAASPSGNWANDFVRLSSLPPLQVRPSLEEGPSTIGLDQENRTLEASDSASWLIGRHQIRGGAQWARRAIRLSNFGDANGRFGFTTDAPFDPAVAATYPVSFNLRIHGPAEVDVANVDTLGVFIQDEWRAGGGLTLSAGMRWDRDDAVAEHDDIAPRLGFAWSPWGSSRTVFRGGMGRFYDQTRLGRWAQPMLNPVRLTRGVTVRVPDVGRDQKYFYDLAQRNGISTLEQLRDLLVRTLEENTSTSINPNPTVDHPGRVQPYVDTITLGAQHEVSPGFAVGVDLVHSESRKTLLLVDLNPSSRSAGGRPNISVLEGRIVSTGSISTLLNAGGGRYQAAQLSARKRMTAGLGARLAYTYADSEGTYGNAGPLGAPNTAYFQTRSETGYDFDTGEIIGEPLRLNLDDPRNAGQPVGWHRRHNLAVAGVWMVPRTTLSFSWVYRYMSGDRLTLTTSSLLDNGRPAPAPAGTYDAVTPSGIGREGVRFEGTISGGENPDFSRLDLRFAYSIPLRRRDAQVSLSGDVFNAADRTNFVNAGGTTVGSSGFLTPTAAFSPRQFQLGARLSF